MFYQLTKPFAKIAFLVFFRKIYFTGRQLLPADKPVILAANHPTAFIEPCVLACWLDRPLYFLARGDLYLKPFFKVLYDCFHLIPVFRVEDAGYGKVKRNYDSFERCYEALNRGKVVMILAEGVVKQEKRLRPLRKGTARIALSALEKNAALDLHIVPVGVNYTHADRFRSDVMISFGEPIRASDFRPDWQRHPGKATNALTGELARRLSREVVHIELPEDEDLAERFFELARNDRQVPMLPPFSTSAEPLEEEKSIADIINGLPNVEKALLKRKVERYFSRLHELGVSDAGLMDRGGATFSRLVLLVLSSPLFLAGYVFHYPPFWFAHWLAKKIAPSIEYLASCTIAFGMAIYAVYWLAAIGLGYGLAGWAGVVCAVVMPLLGGFSLIFMDCWKRYKRARAALRLSPARYKELIDMRRVLRLFPQ